MSRLDDIQQAAVAETIYSKNLIFDEARFKAKYGQLPSFGASIITIMRMPRMDQRSLGCCFIMEYQANSPSV